MKERPIRILIASASLDGHVRGPLIVAKALRDSGMEVIWGGKLTAEQIATTAISESVDVVGIHVGGRIETVKRIVEVLRKEGYNGTIIAGGTITPPECRILEEMGVKTFPPGSPLTEIIDYIKKTVTTRL
jgi:methylmalonyl-CoA mutase C-terminal domain/subunit